MIQPIILSQKSRTNKSALAELISQWHPRLKFNVHYTFIQPSIVTTTWGLFAYITNIGGMEIQRTSESIKNYQLYTTKKEHTLLKKFVLQPF